MSVTMTEVKDILRQTVTGDLVNEGFSFNKTTFHFTKKVNKNFIRCDFVFNNFTPFRVEFSFLFKFKIHEIDIELANFFKSINQIYKRSYTFLICEGDFHPKTIKDSPKFRAAFTHKVTEISSIIPQIVECKTVLREDFLSRLNAFSNLNQFHDFVCSEPEQVINLGFVLPALIAAKLCNKDQFLNVYQFVYKKLGLEEKDERYYLKSILDKLLVYSSINR